MSWTHVLENPKPIESIYSQPPSLDSVRLHEIRLLQDGPTAELRFELNSYPENPPQKWIDRKCNRAQLTLKLVDVVGITVNGWDVDNIGNVNLAKVENEVRLTFTSEGTSIECRASFVYVQELSAYCKGDAP